MNSAVMDEQPRCDWLWQNGDGTIARKCIRPPGHAGNHIGFWSASQETEDHPEERS